MIDYRIQFNDDTDFHSINNTSHNNPKGQHK